MRNKEKKAKRRKKEERVHSCLFKERDVLVIFAETNADILRPDIMFCFFCCCSIRIWNSFSSFFSFFYFEGTNSQHSAVRTGTHCGSLLGPKTYSIVLLILILTLSLKYLASIPGKYFENEGMFIHRNHREILKTLLN